MESILDILINKSINHIKKVFKQGAKFAASGLISTIIDYSIYISLTRLTDYFSGHYVQANMISFCFGLITSYLLNKYWTFNDGHNGHSLKQIIKYFVIIFIGSFVLAQSTFYVLVHHTEIYDLIAKLIGIFIGFLWNFSISRRHVWN
ncbi:MAG: GtrA family protein [Candidatus Komeilibacteria bacterium]